MNICQSSSPGDDIEVGNGGGSHLNKISCILTLYVKITGNTLSHV